MTSRGTLVGCAALVGSSALVSCGSQVAPLAAPMRLLAVGDAQSCVVDERDRVFCWGFVGGLETPSAPPTLIATLPGVEQLLPRAASVCARLRDGTVHCAGANDGLQLGAEGPERRAFAPVAGLRDVVALFGGAGRTCARSRDQSLRCWGSYAERTEDGGWIVRRVPVTEIALPRGVRRFHEEHLCVELESGDVMCESLAPFGALVGRWLPAVGADERAPSFDVALTCREDVTAGVVRCAPRVPDAPPGFVFAFATYDGACGTIGEKLFCRSSIDDPRIVRARPSPFAGWSVLDLPSIAEARASQSSVCALDANRLPFCWGSDSYGELGLGRRRYATRAVDVALGERPVRAVLPFDATVAFDRAIVRFDALTLAVEDEPRDAWRTPFAPGAMRRTTLLETTEPITQSARVDDTVCVLAGRTRCRQPDGTLVEPFGDDTGRTRALWLDRAALYRVRIDGGVDQALYPLLVGDAPRVLPFRDVVAVIGDSDNVCALDARGELRCIGSQFPGTIGRDGAPPTAPPERIASDVRSLHGTLLTPCYIDRAGAPFCWGSQSGWIFGLEGSRPVPLPRRVPFDRPVVDISAAAGVVLVIDAQGAVHCRGDNFSGTCGDPPSRTPSDWRRVEGIDDAVAVRAEPGQSCAVRRSGALACWGSTSGDYRRFGAQHRSSGAVYIPIPAGP